MDGWTRAERRRTKKPLPKRFLWHCCRLNVNVEKIVVCEAVKDDEKWHESFPRVMKKLSRLLSFVTGISFPHNCRPKLLKTFRWWKVSLWEWEGKRFKVAYIASWWQRVSRSKQVKMWKVSFQGKLNPPPFVWCSWRFHLPTKSLWIIQSIADTLHDYGHFVSVRKDFHFRFSRVSPWSSLINLLFHVLIPDHPFNSNLK